MSSPPTETLKQTVLYQNHTSLGAKMTPFSGYQIPVWYEGLKQEHLAVRSACGVFDISHMGCFDISGKDAEKFLQELFCNDIAKTKTDTMVYGMFLNENGTILDDVMIGKLPNSYYLVVNAGNKQKIIQWMDTVKNKLSCDVTIQDLNSDHGFIAIQGPTAEKSLSQTLAFDFNAIGRFRVRPINIDGEPVIASRTGYTGEDGFELLIPNASIGNIWNKLMDAGINPCGLGARDSLRIEAGLPLYGQELSESITPLETRYPWVISFDTNFIGKDALLEQKKRSHHTTGRTTVGFTMESRMIPRAHYAIQEGGEVTSGTLSPSLGKPIGMALVPQSVKEAGHFNVDIRGKFFKANICDVPFE